MPNGKEYYFEYFNYNTGYLVLGAAIGATITAVLNISNDADYQGKYITITVLQAGLVVLNWGGEVQINDSGPGRLLFNQPIPVDAIRGNGELPYAFDPPRLFKRNSSIEITFTNNVATATNVALVLHGAKLRPING